MNRKWKPSASQRRAFADRMSNPAEKAEYLAQKEAKAAKKRAGSKFDYATAGGEYVPTAAQYDAAVSLMGSMDLTYSQADACNMVMYGYNNKEKVHHDNIHIVNELIRNQSHL